MGLDVTHERIEEIRAKINSGEFLDYNDKHDLIDFIDSLQDERRHGVLVPSRNLKELQKERDQLRADAMKARIGVTQEAYDKLKTENERLKFELELAIAHDRQPYPTAEAYELACRTRNKYRDENEKLKSFISELQDKVDDKLRSIMVGNLSFLVDSYRSQISAVFDRAFAQDGKNESP